MTTRRTSILAGLLLASLFCRADAADSNPLTSAEYRAELDRLLSTTQQLTSSSPEIPETLRHVPQSWHVHADQQEFEISTEGLQRDVRRYEQDKSASNAIAIRRRLESLRRDMDGFEKPPADISASRTELNSILAQPEFVGRGPKWKWLAWIDQKLGDFRDKIRDWLFNVVQSILRILGRLFGWTSIPTVGKAVVYGLSGVALAALLYIAYRNIFRGQKLDEVVPKNLPVSAKQWSIWLAEARAAAAKGDWRDAIHLAYWAGISFLERQGFWKPDRARTPREYLRLLSGESEQRQTLVALTRIFELAWYAKRDASEQTFSQTLEQLEKLGCR
jgi:hypothetical protein